MAPKKKGGGYKDQLSDFGISAGFQFLVDQAIRNQWTASEFEQHLVRSRSFQKLYPGLVDADGNIQSTLAAGSQNLQAAVNKYKVLRDQYSLVAREFPGIKLNAQKIGALIGNQVSVDEFARRSSALSQVRTNPGLKDLFNEELKALGKPPLDDIGWMKFMAGASGRNFYDIYEGAVLRAQGLNLTAEEALAAARSVGAPGGGPADLGGIIAQVRSLKSDIAPELAREGITETDLIQLAGGSDPKGLTPILERLVAQRRALKGYSPGVQGSRGTGGGLSLYPDQADNQLFAE